MTLNDRQWPFYVKLCFGRHVHTPITTFRDNCVKTAKCSAGTLVSGRPNVRLYGYSRGSLKRRRLLTTVSLQSYYIGDTCTAWT